MKILRGLEHFSYEGRLRDLELFPPGEEKVEGRSYRTFQCLRGPTRNLESDFEQGHVWWDKRE